MLAQTNIDSSLYINFKLNNSCVLLHLLGEPGCSATNKKLIATHAITP